MFAASDPHLPLAYRRNALSSRSESLYATLLTSLESGAEPVSLRRQMSGKYSMVPRAACRHGPSPRQAETRPIRRGRRPDLCDGPEDDIGEAIMIEPKLEVPAELRDLAEKTIDQAEKAFGMFFDAAGKSMTSMPGPGTEISKQALSFTEQNIKAAFEHARKLVHATDLQEAMRIQSEFLRSQFTNAGEHMRQITGGVMSAAEDYTKGKF